jgi:hypothetical protein
MNLFVVNILYKYSHFYLESKKNFEFINYMKNLFFMTPFFFQFY